MTRKRSHIHQYMRIYPHGLSGSVINKARAVWACALPDCTHFMPHNVASQVEGKLSLCNQCMEPFVLDNLNMKMDKPVCAQCSMPFDSEIDADDIMLRMKLAQMFDISSDMVTPGMLEDYKEKIKK